MTTTPILTSAAVTSQAPDPPMRLNWITWHSKDISVAAYCGAADAGIAMCAVGGGGQCVAHE